MPLIDQAHFHQPPAEYRPVAMWFLNGSLSEDEIRRQVREMAGGGVGAIQIAARTGLTTPYLSDRWFHLVRLALDEARRLGLRVWLADEYPYPSGASGGEVVLRHPEYRAWHMRATRVMAAPGEEVRAVAPGTVLLRACAVPVIGGEARWEAAIGLDGAVGLVQHQQVLFQPSSVYLTTRRYMSNGPQPTLHWRAPGGAPGGATDPTSPVDTGDPTGPEGTERWDVWLIAAAEIERYKFFGAYVDLCNADAVQLFLETTYRRTLDRLGQEAFRRLDGFFVDEAHPQNWSWRLPGYFRERCGYDVYEALPALWTDTGPQTAQIRYDYMQSITELFVDSFHRPLAEWCRQHDVQLSLEVGSTRNVVQRHADIPGIDPGHHKVGVPLNQILARELPSYRGNLNFPASLAAQTGKRRVLDELFHSVGWSLTLQDMKAMLDRAAARGANLFAFHAFCYTIGGLKKWDAPPSEFDQNPYWTHFPLLAAYAGRLAYALSCGQRVAPIAVVDPITSLWAHGEAVGAGKDALAERMAGDWTYLMRELAAAQRPHDNLDPLLLAEAIVDKGVLRVGEAEYQVIILPPMTTLECTAWSKLEELVEAGGTVIACGLLPCEQIEPESDVVARCAAAFGADPERLRAQYAHDGPSQDQQPGVDVRRSGNFVLLGTTGTLAGTGAAETLLDLLETLVPAEVRLWPEARGEARRQFLLAHRRDETEDLYLIVNSSMEEHDCEV
ncbi:MAG TPA: glycosyl hydrolase, partial [Chloroflexota bacterium]|nr:glycosyl hydrolase [Chloroflexota bacterium]